MILPLPTILLLAGLLPGAGPTPCDLSKADVAGVRLTPTAEKGWRLEGEKDNSWGYATFPDAGRADVAICGTFQVVRPAKIYTPKVTYFPLTFRYRCDEPGYDFGIVVRRQSSGAFYRFQFSTRWKDVCLWKEGQPGTDPEAPSIPSGFFAAVARLDIRPSQQYAFAVSVTGNRLRLAVDGRPLLDYEDRLLPLDRGGWAVGAFHGAEVRVGGLTAGEPARAVAAQPRPRPQFRLETWHDAKVIFDGAEPIARLTQGTAAWINDAKFRPGYRAQLAWPIVFDWVRNRASTWKELRSTGDTVVASAVYDANELLAGRGQVTLRYDARQGGYVYDVALAVTVKQDNDRFLHGNRNALYFANTYPYNPMPPADETLKANWEGWSTAASPYRMALVKGADGRPYRWPIQHFYGPFGVGAFQWDLAADAYFIMYPEKVVCPAVEIVALGENGNCRLRLDSCCSYWDMHYWAVPFRAGQRVTQLKTGETYGQRIRIKGCPAAEADKLMARSRLLPLLDTKIEAPYYVCGVNRFAGGGDVERTACRLIWEGSARWDKTTGRGDSFSMKMVDNATLGTYVGYNGASATAPAAELTAWVRTPGWQGQGIRLGVATGPFSMANVEWGADLVPQPGAWQKLTFKIPQPTRGLFHFWLQSRGKGTLWVDDVEYTPLKALGG